MFRYFCLMLAGLGLVNAGAEGTSMNASHAVCDDEVATLFQTAVRHQNGEASHKQEDLGPYHVGGVAGSVAHNQDVDLVSRHAQLADSNFQMKESLQEIYDILEDIGNHDTFNSKEQAEHGGIVGQEWLNRIVNGFVLSYAYFFHSDYYKDKDVVFDEEKSLEDTLSESQISEVRNEIEENARFIKKVGIQGNKLHTDINTIDDVKKGHDITSSKKFWCLVLNFAVGILETMLDTFGDEFKDVALTAIEDILDLALAQIGWFGGAGIAAAALGQGLKTAFFKTLRFGINREFETGRKIPSLADYRESMFQIFMSSCKKVVKATPLGAIVLVGKSVADTLNNILSNTEPKCPQIEALERLKVTVAEHIKLIEATTTKGPPQAVRPPVESPSFLFGFFNMCTPIVGREEFDQDFSLEKDICESAQQRRLNRAHKNDVNAMNAELDALLECTRLLEIETTCVIFKNWDQWVPDVGRWDSIVGVNRCLSHNADHFVEKFLNILYTGMDFFQKRIRNIADSPSYVTQRCVCDKEVTKVATPEDCRK